jgi:hypothetical protein
VILLHYEHLGACMVATFVVDDFGDLFQIVPPFVPDTLPELERRTIDYDAYDHVLTTFLRNRAE